MAGIYCIRNLANGKMYFGQSKNPKRRFGVHKASLRGGYHENEFLQRAWNKYGEGSFEFSIIETCEESSLNELEILYISKYATTKDEFGYNLDTGGRGTLRMNSERTRRKISLSLIGKKYPVRAKISEETRRRLSESHKDKKQSKETIEKRVSQFRGKTRPKEVGRKISESKMGKPQPFHLGNKYGLGKKQSDETKRKRRETFIKNGRHPNGKEIKLPQ